MSRTIRRKNVSKSDERSWTHDDDEEHAILHGGWKTYTDYYTKETKSYFSKVAFGGRKSVPLKGKEYDKKWWRYHSDCVLFYSGNKGSGEWINWAVQRPYRQQAKREIHKYLRNEDYEVMIEDKPKRPWWD